LRPAVRKIRQSKLIVRPASFCTFTMIAIVLGGCAQISKSAPQTRVSYQARIAPGAPRYEETEDEISNSPTLLENPAPVYPQAAIALHLPKVAVAAKVIVDREGKVDEVRITPATDSAASPTEFDVAVREAALRWQFTPLTFTRWEEVKDAQGNVVDSRQISVERRPFSLDYEFYFELRDGKPVVGSAAQSTKTSR